jgi:hypothetical protein
MKHAVLVTMLCCGLAACASSDSPGNGSVDAGSQSCNSTADCEDDGIFCNGGVVCREHECLPSEPPSCGDGINCTVDMCSEELLGCVNVPHDELCEEGLACLDAEGCGVPPACEFSTDCLDDAFLCNGVPDCVDAECVSTPLDCADTDDCTADGCTEGIGCENIPYDHLTDVDHCTDACTPCPEPTLAQVNVERVCDQGVCGFVCLSGYWDVNNNLADGCEIACPNDPTTTLDVPDDGFEDQNCDGIDGTVSDGIFVSESGSNANPGTMAFPVKTIGTGFTKAIAGGKHHLYVSAGNYAETVTVNATNQGISVHGGYLHFSNWLRDGTRGVVTGPRTGTLRVNGVTTATTVEYLEFSSASASSGSASSHGVVVENSSGLTLRYLTARAGNGGNGSQGANAGSLGANGGDGVPGTAGYEDDGYFYCAGDTPDPAYSYSGGASCVGATTSTRGGDGHRGCKTNGSACAGVGGDFGTPDAAGTASDPGYGNAGSAGGSGYAGATGGNGSNGGGGNGGYLSGTEWVPYGGGAGVRGVDGSGGGGGAGGGSNHSSGTCNDWGGGGGGGGGGGCGGTPGDGGTGGGASIAVLLIGSNVAAVQVDTITGNGGTGGAGRSGGNGGSGGLGRGGGGGYDESRAGGSGGNGGGGGRGGHGGGGAGGWVYGVFRSGSTWSDGGTTNPTLGTPGNGGTSSGNAGSNGQAVDIN